MGMMLLLLCNKMRGNLQIRHVFSICLPQIETEALHWRELNLAKCSPFASRTMCGEQWLASATHYRCDWWGCFEQRSYQVTHAEGYSSPFQQASQDDANKMRRARSACLRFLSPHRMDQISTARRMYCGPRLLSFTFARPHWHSAGSSLLPSWSGLWATMRKRSGFRIRLLQQFWEF
jgi:hypothetical protein